VTSLKGRKLELRFLAESDSKMLYEAIFSSRASLRRRLRWPSLVAGSDDCLAFIRSCAEAARRGVEKVYGVFELRSQAFIGVVALQRLLESPGVAEISCWIRSDRQERGYAVEAGKLLVGRAFKREDLQRLYARIDPANRAARKVLQRLGLRYEGCLRQEKRLNGRWVDQECWGLLKKEWG
jgi:RimJ/RimL family protein N-acetyltransferase